MKHKKRVFLLISIFLISFQPVYSMEEKENKTICLKGTCSQIEDSLRDIKEGNLTLVVFNGANCSMCNFEKYAERISEIYLVSIGINRSPSLEVLTKLYNLKLLDLHNSRLTLEAVETICSCRILEKLNLSKNALQEVPQKIKQLGSLTNLDLSDNEFETFPKTLTQLSNLKELNLGNNEMRELSPQISQLKNLESLNLHGNDLKDVPQALGGLSKLTQLYLQNNCLNTEAIKSFCLFQNLQDNLETLALEDNKLEGLPPEIGNLRSLKQLFLRKNCLTSLPKEIGKLELVKLDLIYNELTSDAVETICSSKKLCANLTLLSLACNKIEEPPRGIERLGKIKKIRLFGNGLDRKRQDAIRGALPNVAIEF